MSKHIVVVGAGLIGLFVSLYATEAGHTVSLVEKDPVTGGGAARINAGEIVPSLAGPMPEPGIIRTGLMQSYKQDAALRIALPPSAMLSTWLLRFAANCTARAVRETTPDLVALAARSVELFKQLGEVGVNTPISAEGNLKCFKTREAAEASLATLQTMAHFGVPVPTGLMTGSALRELEPMLTETVQWGFHIPEQLFLDPSALVDALTAELQRRGVEFHLGCPVTDIPQDGIQPKVTTPQGTISGDVVVLAAGAWSRELSSSRSVRNITPGKGYSFSVNVEKLPQHVLNFPQSSAVATPMTSRLRFAGTMEFDNSYLDFNERCIERVANAAKPYLHGVDWDSKYDVAVGPRPMTPDGVPVIGWSRDRVGTIVATGHNMLGLTWGPATAELVVAMIEGKPLPSSASRFQPR